MPFSAKSRLNRRRFIHKSLLSALGGLAGFTAAGSIAESIEHLPFARGERQLVAFPQKRPLLLLSTRPPQLETPFQVFNEGVFTPNDAFFVRYHLSQIPTSIDPEKFHLEVTGKVRTPLSLTLEQLKTQFTPIEMAAVNQCSGNGRGFSQPRVPGGQLGNGAMGNALWKGVSLKDVLNKADVVAGARQVTFQGLDRPPNDKIPQFVKSLDVDHALDGEVMLAYEMNGEALPMLNGFPLRLVVPGYYGTYWVKHLSRIEVLEQEFNGFWVASAYRVPDNPGACIEPGSAPTRSRPISRFNVRSFITSLADGERIALGKALTVKGIAFDGGFGIERVLFSNDDGVTWREASPGKNYGKYSFREWTCAFTPKRAGAYVLKVCATNRLGQTQPNSLLWNPSGYMRNVIEPVRVTAA